MKKIYSTALLVFLVSTMAVYAQAVGVEALPKQAKDFLDKYFKGVDIVYVERDYDEFEVNLNNGIEIDFMKAGEWKTVDGKYTAIPTGFIPAAVLASVKKAYPKASIIKIEKDWGGFDIELDNRMELKMDKNGKINRTEYDD